MDLHYTIDFSKFSQEELQAWAKAYSKNRNKQNLEFIKQDLSIKPMGFPFEKEQATEWEQKNK